MAYYVEHAGKRTRFRTYEDALEFGHAAVDGERLVFIVKGWISQTLLVVLPQEREGEAASLGVPSSGGKSPEGSATARFRPSDESRGLHLDL